MSIRWFMVSLVQAIEKTIQVLLLSELDIFRISNDGKGKGLSGKGDRDRKYLYYIDKLLRVGDYRTRR